LAVIVLVLFILVEIMNFITVTFGIDGFVVIIWMIITFLIGLAIYAGEEWADD
jgi:uncharacterized RDD family membrane protein YckC